MISEMLNQILKEGRRHPLVLSTNCPQDLYSAILAGLRRSCEENNFPLEQCILMNDNPDSVMRQVSQLLTAHVQLLPPLPQPLPKAHPIASLLQSCSQHTWLFDKSQQESC